MLDRYLWGEVERISPEAPVPVVRVGRQEHRLGGAGSVTAMLAALEADVTLAAVAGDDPEGGTARRLLEEIGVPLQPVLADPSRPTTLKERLLGRTHGRYAQQMIRVDREDARPLDGPLADKLLKHVWERLDGTDLIVVSDYGKGVCAGETAPKLVAIARAAGVPVLVDPARGTDYRRYAGATAVTPNRTEAGEAAGMSITSPQNGLEAALRLVAFGIESAVVTLDRDGMAWADRRGRSRLFPVRARQVYDITGAGDMVIAALGFALALGADMPTGIELANLAAGLEVERLGVVPVTRQEIAEEITHNPHATGHKIVSVDQLQHRLAHRRQRGERIAMTNGCYDLLHPGHVASLQEARRHGDCLVVGLNSDRSVRELKGPDRPIIDETGRSEMLAALACVDYVVLFDDAEVTGLVAQVRPDVLVKSDQYAPEEVVGHEVVQSYGGQIALARTCPGYSTTQLSGRLRPACPARSS